MKRKIQIGVVGSAGPEEYAFTAPDPAMYRAAEALGRQLAKKDCIVVNGGKGGVMEAVCRGAKVAQGITVAEVAGIQRGVANEFVDIEVVTGLLNVGGPSALVGMCDGIIALGGGAGTLQEICVAYRLQKPIVLLGGFGGWTDRLLDAEYLDERRLVPFVKVTSADKAVTAILTEAKLSD